MPFATELAAFADAAVADASAPLASAREALLEAVGPEALVDAAATVANFERMVRIADGCGIPLDAPLEMMTGDLRGELGLGGFAGAANTPDAGPVARAVARALRPLAGPLLRFSYAARDRFRAG